MLDITICYYCCRTGILDGARFVQGFSLSHTATHTAQARSTLLACMTRVVGAEQSVCRCGPERETSVFSVYGIWYAALGAMRLSLERRCRGGGTWQLSRLSQLGLTHTERCCCCCCLGFVVIALLRPRAVVREVFALFASHSTSCKQYPFRWRCHLWRGSIMQRAIWR